MTIFLLSVSAYDRSPILLRKRERKKTSIIHFVMNERLVFSFLVFYFHFFNRVKAFGLAFGKGVGGADCPTLKWIRIIRIISSLLECLIVGTTNFSFFWTVLVSWLKDKRHEFRSLLPSSYKKLVSVIFEKVAYLATVSEVCEPKR